MTTRSPERKQFLANLMTTAIEHGGYGFPETIEYEPFADEPYAVIIDRYDEEDDPDALKPTRITVDTMASGLAKLQNDVKNPSDWVKELLLASRTNGEDGDFDVIGALAVLEYAIYGEIRYA